MAVSELSAAMRRHKSAITRAKNSGDHLKVCAAVENAVDDFDRVGWPDNWPSFRLPLDDLLWSPDDRVRTEARRIHDRF